MPKWTDEQKEAIYKELSRDGQVYILINNMTLISKKLQNTL